MKKTLALVGLCVFWLVGMPLSGFAAQTIDAPHLNLDGDATNDDCSTCHFSTDTTTGNEIVPGSTCTGCHISDTGGYTDTSAPLAQTHQGFTCETCHNPHVSQQFGIATALVEGTVANVVPGATQTTMDVTVTTGVGTWPSDPTLWTEKSVNGQDASGVAIRKINRGLTLWVTVGADNYSFEVTDTASFPSITVKGVAPAITDGSAFELHYGQLLAHKVTAGVSYRSGASPVTLVDASNEPAFVNAAGTDGICQTCHTITKHYTNAAVEGTHHVGETCTKCHLHSAGFSPDTTDCKSCHDTYPEPPNTGIHPLHAGSTGYNFPCEVCHKGGMTDWNPGPNDVVQIGFNLVPLGTVSFSGANTTYDGKATGTLTPIAQYGAPGYQGENDTQITAGGTLTCSNIYCHSTGYSAGVNDHTSGAATASRWTSSTATINPLRWDGTSPDPQGDTTKCNNCHDNGNFPAATFTSSTYSSLTSKNLDGYNVHWPHALFNVGCMYCHNDTVNTTDSTLVTNKNNHANGLVDIKSGGTYGGNAIGYTYDPTTKSCSGTIQCHIGRTWVTLNTNNSVADDVVYPTVVASPNVDPVIMPYDVADTFVFANDPYVLHFTPSAYDFDYYDLVKNAAYLGHKPGAKGKMRMNFGNVCGPFVPFKMADYPKTIEVTCDYGQAKLAPDFPNYKYSFVYILWDNHPPAVDSARAAGWRAAAGVDDDGVTEPVPYRQTPQLNVTPGFSLIDDPMNNVRVQGRYTVLPNTGHTVNIEICGSDADYNDPTKNAYYGAGHQATDGTWVQIDWSGEGATTGTDFLLTDVEQCRTYSFNYDAIASGGASSTGVSVGRGDAWINLYLCDNHYLNVPADNQLEKSCFNSSWFNVSIP